MATKVGIEQGRSRPLGIQRCPFALLITRYGGDNKTTPRAEIILITGLPKVISEADINRKTDPTKAGYQPTGLYTYPMFINRDGTVDFKPPIDRPSVIFEVAPDPRNKELSANGTVLTKQHA